jgi:hypothetical protein
MATAHTENVVLPETEDYVPFTPFQDLYAFEPELDEASQEAFQAAPPVSPFVSEYEGLDASTSPEAEELHELLYELYDRELDEVLNEIAQEAWNATSDRAEAIGETVGSSTAEQFLEEWIAPLRDEAEAMLDNIAESAAEHDIASMSEAEVDSFFERFEPSGTGLEAYFEDFLGGLWNKAKTLVKKVGDVAKKGLSMIPGVGFLLDKLKGLVRPLLDRVLKFALDKLPPALRPVASQLAQRILGKTASEAEEEFAAPPAGPDATALQRQFDLEAATLLFAEEAEQEVIVTEALYEAERTDGAPIAELDEARERFVDELESGVDPRQALENFIPAVMAVLPIARTAIGIIGRQRVVDFLAGFLANLIRKYVPPESAKQLSQAIVDAGLRLMTLEAPSESEVQALAPQALADVVEDTVRRVGELDETTLEHPALLEAASTEAFHEAAAASFPPQLLIPEVHEATVAGTWVAMPLGKRKKQYRKYTKVFDVEVTPQIAESLKTFGGATLASFLKERLGVAPPIKARVHLFQVRPGTSFARIAKHERAPGLGTAAKRAWSQLHPLTPEAAGLLLRQPRLGRAVPGEFRSTRGKLALGQRVYFLDIAGAPAALAGAPGTGERVSEVNLTLDFRKDEFRVSVYFGERIAQDIAARMRSRDAAGALLAAKKVFGPGVATALGGDIRRHVKILSEVLPQEQFLGGALGQVAAQVRSKLVSRVADWVGKAVADYAQSRSGEFVAASEDPAQGVTMVITIVSPPGAPLVRRLMRGEGIGPEALRDVDSLFRGDPKLDVRTVPGFRFD